MAEAAETSLLEGGRAVLRGGHPAVRQFDRYFFVRSPVRSTWDRFGVLRLDVERPTGTNLKHSRLARDRRRSMDKDRISVKQNNTKKKREEEKKEGRKILVL
jgi:hypothetical protein